MLELQRRYWPYFIEKLLEMSEKENPQLENETNKIGSVENGALLDNINNLQIFQHFYDTLHHSVAEIFQEMILASTFQYIEAIYKYMQLNGWSFFKFFRKCNREIKITRKTLKKR